jgi:hypothetical protein
MKNLMQEYNNLQGETIAEFNRLSTLIGHQVYLESEDDIEDFVDDLILVSLAKESNGQIYFAHVLEVSSEHGIYMAKENETDSREWVKFTDISDLYYQIALVNNLTGVYEKIK